MEPADDRGSVTSRLRAFLPLLICFLLLFVGLLWLFHASQSRRATVRFSVSVEGATASFYSVRLNGAPYQSGEPCGLGSKSITIEAQDAEPFHTNVFTWYSGADLGKINLTRSKGTLTVEVSPEQNKVFLRGPYLEKQISNCRKETITIPVGEYHVVSEFEHFRIDKRVSVKRNLSSFVSIRPEVASATITADPADADFRLECRAGFPIVLAGRTPNTIVGLPAGKYDFIVSRGRFQKNISVDLTANATNRVNVLFDYAKVTFKSEPADAEIRSGTESFGRTPVVVTLIPGEYHVSFNRDGYFAQEAKFEVKGNEHREIALNLGNIAFAEAYRRVESALSQFNPDFSAALSEIEKALRIEPQNPAALNLRDEALFRQMIAQATELARRNDLKGALKMVNSALEKRPSAEAALELKAQLERSKRGEDARLADERKQRPRKVFTEFVGGIKHNDLFDTQKITAKASSDKVLSAVHRAFSSGKPSWTMKRDQSLGGGVYIVEAESRSLTGKQRAVVLVGQASDETCEVIFKLWQYTLSSNVQIINGKMTEDSWSPVHPNYSSWAAEIVNSKRARDVEAIREKIETEIKTQ